MLEWLDGLAGPDYAPALLWTFAALVLLAIVLVIIRLVRRMTFGTYVAGGRNRKTRLAVMDATAVDSHRRLVLVRRDDIEHLLLIGGPTDVVVERDIRLVARRPAPASDPGQAQTRPRPQQPAPVSATPVAKPQAAPPPAMRFPEPVAAPRPQPYLAPAAPRAMSPSSNPGLAKTQTATKNDPIDDALMQELEMSLDDEPVSRSIPGNVPSLDDEMTKLLGELSTHKK